MAKLGGILLGGTEPTVTNSEQFSSGIGFPLETESEIDFLWESSDSRWQVEIKKKHLYVVARARYILDYDKLIIEGLEQVQRCLDVLAAKKLGLLIIDHPESAHTALFNESGRTIVRHFALIRFVSTVNCTATVKDKDGNIIPQPPIPEPIWTPAFRYYRLSQTSQDIYEAYRNLYLCFEATLSEICPRISREKEGMWLRRALTKISTKINLSLHCPRDMNPIDYLFSTQYEGMRCKLFHAKFPTALLPFEQINPTDILTAYSGLIRLWHEIAQVYFRFSQRGGVITYQGFKMMMDNTFQQALSIHFTEDDSQAGRNDSQISPKGSPTFQFVTATYLGETKPGIVSIKGEIEIKQLAAQQDIHRICTCLNSELMFVNNIHDGLRPFGVDIFQSLQSISLVNSGQPKTTF